MIISQNQASMGISTDYGIATILGNFSDDFIEDTIKESITYRFRPYGLRSPNYPQLLNNQLELVKSKSIGYEDQIEDKKVDVFNNIIESINSFYGMEVIDDIPDEYLYSIADIMYTIFVSEFTDRMLNFYTQYIINNIDNLCNYLNTEQKSTKSVYAKKIYNNEKLITIYDNMNSILDVIASLDIPLDILITYLSDAQTSNLLTSYITAVDDVYHKGFACFILDPAHRADIITAIRFKFVEATVENKELFDPSNNPYIYEKESE